MTQYKFQLVNGISGDPAVYLYFPQMAESFLFDLGNIHNLSTKEILRISRVFVTHTHVDHFIGFDHLLRILVPHFRIVTIYGPKGIARNISSKLRGYCWNLIKDGQLRFVVVEICEAVKPSVFYIENTNDFEPTPYQEGKVPTFNLQAKDFEIQWIVLDHGTPVMGYKLNFPSKLRVDPSALAKLNLKPGPWIKELQKIAQKENREETSLVIDGKKWSTDDLVDLILTPEERRSAVYLTDFIFSQDNLKKIKEAFKSTFHLFIECNYRNSDRDKAFQKKHLTTKQAALIGAMLSAEQVHFFHISSIYAQETGEALDEAQSFFEAFRQMSNGELETAITAELTLA